MAHHVNQRILLAARPEGEPTLENFRIETADTPEPAAGQVLL
jgi:NADPH-dependent curcumin reductase CurA